MKNNIPYNELKIGKLYNCNSISYNKELIIKGPVLVIKKYKRIVQLLYNTKIVVIFSADNKFSEI